MSAIVLPTEPVKIPDLDCDPTLIEECATDLLAASAQVDDLGSFVAASARVPTWIGSDADQYRAGITEIGQRADAMSLALRGVARRVSVHAGRMITYRATHADLADRRLHLNIAIAQIKGLVAMATEDQVPELQGKCDTLNTRALEFNADVADLTTDVADEEAAMVAAFQEMQTQAQVMKRYQGVADPADAALAAKPGPDASPSAVRAWWESLTEEQQQAIIAAAPGAIGNLDGIPAADRHLANNLALDRDLAALELLEERGVLRSDEKEQLVNARATRDALDDLAERVDPITGEPILGQLYIYDPLAFDGDGRIAISAGDLDTADNVAVVVPGFSNDGGSMVGLVDRAGNIYEAARVDDPGSTNATLMWMGYDAPDSHPFEGDGPGWDVGGVIKEDMAERGGERLADTVDGIRAIREGDQPHITGVGHSYGSTTTGHAATDHGLDVDDIVLLGSPGPGDDAEHASDLGVGSDHVFVGTNSNDPVGGLGDKGWVNMGNVELGLGRDPSEDDFGAIRFQAEATDRGTSIDPFADHSKYFDHNTESLHNIAQIVNGHYDDVEHAEHKEDPWYAGPRDPERDRDVTTPRTRP